MTEEQFKREMHYQLSLSIARSMLRQGIITPDDLRVIDTKMREKYRPLLGCLLAEKP